MGHSDEEPAGNGGVDDTRWTPRLAERDPRERRRRRRRRPAQGGIRGAVALARQPVDEPGADGRRPSRPRAGDALSCHHRSDRAGPDLQGCGRLRPRAGREPNARRPHPRAHLPTHPPLTWTDSKRIWPGSTSWGQASSPLIAFCLVVERCSVPASSYGCCGDEGGRLGLVGQEDRLEARRLEDLLESGRGVLVETQVFVDLENGGRRYMPAMV